MTRTRFRHRRSALSAAISFLNLFYATSLLPFANGRGIPEQLLEIFEETKGFGWTDRAGWIIEKDEYCSWHGIYCYETTDTDNAYYGQIEMIDLSDNGLVGTLPKAVWEMTNLKILKLRDNPDLDVNFTDIGDAWFLENLVLSNTGIKSFEGLENAHKLKQLHLTECALGGSIPDEIYGLTSLEGLYGNYNAFTGSISTQIGKLTELRQLFLFDNELTGTIPDAIGNLLQLESLILSMNALSGSLPGDTLNRLTQLQMLALNRADDEYKGGFTGALPSLTNLRELSELYLQNNLISGTIPNDFLLNVPTMLEITVDISDNMLTGDLGFSRLYDIESISLYATGNGFSTIDEELCNSNWMDGSVGYYNDTHYGCDGLVCPAGTYAPEGRQTYYDECLLCEGSEVIGAYDCATADDMQKNILDQFYRNTYGEDWTFNTWDWETSECKWNGITCNESNEIIEINLSDNNLAGNPGYDIFQLPKLKSLDLSENNIDFYFDGIADAKNLKTLTLYGTNLDSLDDIDQLSATTITELYLSANNLDGTIPDSLYTLDSLEILMISHNENLSGTISQAIGNLSNLRVFRAYGNNLSGYIPSQFGLMDELEELILSENDFMGSIPLEISQMSNLEEISIHQSTNTRGGLSGTLPDFANCKNLAALHLASNSLTGTLPDNFLEFSTVLEDVIEVDLSNNQITGTIPSAWNRHDSLDIDLTDNKITSIPSILCNKSDWQSGNVDDYGCDAILCNKETFNVLGKQISLETPCEQCLSSQYMGTTQCNTDELNYALPILKALYISTNGQMWNKTDGWMEDPDVCEWYGIYCEGDDIVRIGLSENGLTGVPTNKIYDLAKLREIDFNFNEISFNFNGIEAATELNILYLSSTQIDSIQGIGRAKELTTLHLTDNYLAGSIPVELYELTKLEQLFLNYNQFNGRISPKIGDLTNLEALYLTSNKLTGQIPFNIAQLTNLQICGLAENNLGGTIPYEMNALTSLKVLSLQSQQSDSRGSGLSGPLLAFNGLPNIETLFLGNNDLEGTIPYAFLEGITDKSKPIEVDLVSNSLNGAVPSSLSQFDELSIFLAGNDFTSLAPTLCTMEDWMNGELAATKSCDSIMCAPNFYSAYGRLKDGDNTCQRCQLPTYTPFWGSYSCVTDEIQAAQDEQAILEMLYTSLGGKDWHLKENWMDSDVSICDWQGISCIPGGIKSVQTIRLPNNALSGEVPGAIFGLENLRAINLSGNKINFKFDGIDNAMNLHHLNLDDTGLETLDGIQNAVALSTLYASENLFNGFPDQILSLDKLESLVISSNGIGSKIPNLGVLKKSLSFFECDVCGFVGSIPNWLNEFERLEHLSLAGNKLVGSIPNLELMTSLTYLNLSDQISRGGGIDGSLPAFSSSKTLSELYLDQNMLDGSVPTDFLQNVENDFHIEVDLRKNMIHGTIPSNLFSRFDDITLLLANNEISMIPEEICPDTATTPTLTWNNGDIQKFGCDGLLCQPGYYNELGRETEGHECVQCTLDGYTTFYGSTICGENAQKDTLILFYYGLGGADWTRNDNWMKTQDVCEWYGIECESGAVIRIELEENSLLGKVPTDLFDISTLVEINLKTNDITFSFDGIDKLTQLEILSLSDTGISSIEGIARLSSSLIQLHLTDNSLSTFPEELYEMTNLKDLYLNYNEIDDYMSPRIGNMDALENLFIFQNKMKGSLPTEIGNLQNLQSLALGGNFFTGPIPTEINELQNLEILALQRNIKSSSSNSYGLTGNLPALDNLPNIKEIYLSNQDLSGTIPETFLGGIRYKDDPILIDLSMNNIEGSLPFTLKKFKSVDIYLGGNEIESIDASFCQLKHWMGGGVDEVGCDAILCPSGTYNMYGKQTSDDMPCKPCPFTYTAMFWGSTSCSGDATDYNEREILAIFYDATGGSDWSETSNWKEDDVSICDWYGVHCASEDDLSAAKVVKHIQLHSNALTGTVPPQIFGLRHLEMLNLRDNHIDFEFHGIGEAMMLKELYLDSTDISDIDGISEAKYLKTLHLQQNDFHGSSIPEHLFDLSNLKHLYISDSNLGGKLPPKIGQLTTLEDFYCHGNELTGTIPREIGQLNALEVLVLSENKFIGPIPIEINNLSHLQSLYIDSFTRRNAGLSGPLPSFSGMSALHDIYLGSNSLTGFFPDDFLSGLTNKEGKITVGLKSNRLEGTLPSSLSRLEKLDIDISGNFITGIDGELCEMEKWNKGGVDKFKCNAILCPAGYYNQFGYQLNERSSCRRCGGSDESLYLGVTLCQSEVKQREREILEGFYHACSGDKWKNKENWLEADIDICDWYGISCRQGGTVDSILLGSNNIVGTPPRNIFELTNLKWLWLYSNPINFSFHGIGQAQHLTSLLLDSTGLTSIDGIGDAYQLTDLDLRFNSLTGTFPNEISFLINLESLSLTENYLTGSISSLSRLHKLKSLRLGENMLSGPLPDFSTHTKLKTLDCSGNTLTGEIPTNFLASVASDNDIFIDLSSNQLKGEPPQSLDRFNKMTLLLRDNFITRVDPDLCDNNAWNDGDIGLFECDGLLCPPGTYAEGKGRQSNDGTKCAECKKAKFYGQSQCLDLTLAYGSSGTTKSCWSGLILTALLGWIMM